MLHVVLTRDEIAEDFAAIRGTRAPRRPPIRSAYCHEQEVHLQARVHVIVAGTGKFDQLCVGLEIREIFAYA